MYEYHMPTRVFFGRDCLLEKGKALSRYGSPVLIVTGKSSQYNGSYNHLIETLKKHSIEYKTINSLSPNPRVDGLNRVMEETKSLSFKAVIGLGGGSYIDAAKALAVTLPSQITAETIFNEEKRSKVLPIIAVPTTAGTGSEATQYSVLNDTTDNKKKGFGDDRLFPSLSFIDPSYASTLPIDITKDTALDALSHLLEGIYSIKRNPLAYPLISEGINKIRTHLPICEENSQAYDSREALATASLYGGMVIAQTSTTLQHSIGYPLTYHLNIPHGRANAMVMPLIIDFYSQKILPLLESVLRNAGFQSMDDFYGWLKNRKIRFDCPGINRLNLDEITETTLQARNTALSPVAVNKKNLKTLYEKLANQPELSY